MTGMNRKYDVICIGTALVDSIITGFRPEPVSASGYQAESGSLHAGGEAVNTAVASAKLGLKTGIFCRLGMDEAGELVIRTLQKNGVDTALVIREGPTPVTTIFANEDGTRKSITNKALRYGFHPEKEPGRFTDARAVLLGSLFRVPFDDPEIIFSTFTPEKASSFFIRNVNSFSPIFKVVSLVIVLKVIPPLFG